jgi:broad specificity phosphatase PhoE
LIELTFFRHGQAGSRLDYDQLSDNGREQARLLGRYLASTQVCFEQIVCGELRRQRETCSLVLAELDAGGVPYPAPQFSPLWNEFDLDLVYRHVAAALAEADPAFARDFAELQAQVAANSDGIHRRWTHTDSQIIQAWVTGRFELPIEGWDQFRERILAARSTLAAGAPRVAVFTSATPISIWMSAALGIDTPRTLRLAGAQYNTSISRFVLAGTEPVLSSFNETPHLPAPLRTLR